MPKKLVSILIGTRNRREPLVRCVESVLRQNYSRIEVLVLDDFSNDSSTCKLISSSFKDSRISCFRSKRQLGVAGGRNFLMKKAKGEIFIAVDDDAVFSGTEEISHAVDKLSRNPETGILAFKIVDHRSSGERLLIPFSRFDRIRRPEILGEETRVSYYLGGGHAIRRGVIEECGFYQDDLMFGNEELDLSYRAVQQGFEIVYVPEIVVHHHPEPEITSPLGSFSEIYYHVRNRIWLSFRYLPLKYLLTSLLVWISVYGAFALRSWDLRNFAKGVGDGIRMARSSKRTPLGSNAVGYLKNNFGRLWF